MTWNVVMSQRGREQHAWNKVTVERSPLISVVCEFGNFYHFQMSSVE
jgi:hypothetical protein